MKTLTLAAAALATLVAGIAPAQADTLDRRIRINNYTDQNIFEVHVSNVGRSSWGPDQLGSDEVIYARHSMMWNIDDGTGHCNFDFKIVMRDGSERYKYNYNVCAASHLDVTE